MQKWMKRVRGAVGMGLIWGLAWAVIGGGIMEALVDPDGRIMDMWPQFLGIVGFLGGVMFSAVLGVAARRRRFDELSVPQLTGFGALGGLALGALGVAAGGPAVFIAVATLGSAVAAAGTLVVARKAQGKTLAIDDAGNPALGDGDVRSRIGRGE